jgi:hypothetical protein
MGSYLNRVLGLVVAVVTFAAGTVFVSPATASSEDPAIEAMEAMNERLSELGQPIRVQAIEFFTIGQGRPSARILQEEDRWVPGDERRDADGDRITYLISESDGATASGLASAQTTSAISRAMTTWDRSSCLRKLDITRRADSGADATVIDGLLGFGGFGDPFLADIVSAGWLPRALFEAVGGPGGGDSILAFSANFIFVDEDGEATDINGDGYRDTAFNEVYYNDSFGQLGTPRADNPWAIDTPLPAIDVETVALHELGHSLGLGHFGPEPEAVMNPVYRGVQHELKPTDSAGMCIVWASWPRR